MNSEGTLGSDCLISPGTPFGTVKTFRNETAVTVLNASALYTSQWFINNSEYCVVCVLPQLKKKSKALAR